MRLTSTDQTAVIVRIPAQAGPPSREEWRPSLEDMPPAPEPLHAPGLTVLAWLIPVLVTAGVTLWGVTTAGLGEDELATWGMTTISWADFRAVMATLDASIGPYYALMRVWTTVFGDSDLALRLPSVLFAAGTAGLLAAIGIRMSGRRVGITAGLIFAAIPMISRYAHDARPYALTLLAATLATYLLLRVLDKPTFGHYLAYTATVALLGLAHMVALLLLPAHAVIVWQLRRTGRRLALWSLAAAIGVLPVLPLLYVGQRQSGTQIGWIPPLTLTRFGETPALLFGGAIVAGAVMALALAAMSLRGTVVVATAWALVPAAGLAAAAQVTPIWLSRYLLFVLPAWALLAALALRQLTLLRGLVAVAGIAALALPAQADVRRTDGHGTASARAADHLRGNVRPGDTVLYGSASGDQRTARDLVMRYLAPADRPADRLARSLPYTGGRFGTKECPDNEFIACMGRPERVWVVRKTALSDPLLNIGPVRETFLRKDYALTVSTQFTNVTVALFTRRPAGGR